MPRQSEWEREYNEVSRRQQRRKARRWDSWERFADGVHELLPLALDALRDALNQTEDLRLRAQVALALLRWGDVTPQSYAPGSPLGVGDEADALRLLREEDATGDRMYSLCENGARRGVTGQCGGAR